MADRYLIDADVFIQGKNFHYRFCFCRGFWDWIEEGFNQRLIYSIQKVRSELVNGNTTDKARTWAQRMPSKFFLEDVKDTAVMREYGNVMNWANGNTHYTRNAIKDFSSIDRADAFLLAYARAHGHLIVTQEKSNPAKKNKIPIPDAAIGIGKIRTLTIFDLLEKHARSTFQFKS